MEMVKKFFTNNLGLKLLSLVFAALLWLVVVNLEDPTQSRNFTTSVLLTNEQVLTDQGKFYTIPDGANTVTFRVTARRSVIEKLSGSDFSAVADFNNLEDDRRIPVEITANRFSSSLSISSRQQYLYVDVGERMENNFTIDAEITGEPADGFAVDEVSVEPNVLTVSGPAAVVSKIAAVKAVCDVANMSGDTDGKISESVVPVILDESGEEVDKKDLEVNVDTVNVTVSLQFSKSVPIEVETSGTLPEGITLESVNVSPDSVRVKGRTSVLNSFTKIVIPSNVVDLSTIKEDFKTDVDIKSYLPEGVSLLENSSSKAVIIVDVSSQKTHRFEVPTSNLTIDNLSDGYEAEFESKTVSAEITGPKDLIAKLTTSKITGSVDVSGFTEGTHSVDVTLDLDEGLTMSRASTQIRITLKKQKSNNKEEEKTSSEDDEEEEETEEE